MRENLLMLAAKTKTITVRKLTLLLPFFVLRCTLDDLPLSVCVFSRFFHPCCLLYSYVHTKRIFFSSPTFTHINDFFLMTSLVLCFENQFCGNNGWFVNVISCIRRNNRKKHLNDGDLMKISHYVGLERFVLNYRVCYEMNFLINCSKSSGFNVFE